MSNDYQRAMSAYLHGMFQNSLNILNLVILNDPNDAQAIFLRSLCHENLNRPGAAKNDLCWAINVDPSVVDQKSPSKKIVFKYFNKQFLNDWEAGRIRINTQNFLSKQYEQGDVSDQDEGRAQYQIDHIDSQNDQQMERAAQMGLMSSPQHKLSADTVYNSFILGVMKSDDVRVTVNNVLLEHILQDCYIFCATLKRNDKRWQEIPEHFGGPYNAVVKITDFHKFCKRVYHALDRNVFLRQLKIEECSYNGNRSNFPEEQIEASYFTKAKDYEWQCEKKAVFIPRDPDMNLEPQMVEIEVRDLIEFLQFGN